MKIINTKIKNLVLLKTNIYKDKRGFFKEVEKHKVLKKKFVFDCFSFSKKNTLRGLHLQLNKSQAKIISVVQGKILDVVVDLRKKSKTYGKYFAMKFLKIQIFRFLFLKILLMVFCVYPEIVVFTINVQTIEIKKVKLLLSGMINF